MSSDEMHSVRFSGLELSTQVEDKKQKSSHKKSDEKCEEALVHSIEKVSLETMGLYCVMNRSGEILRANDAIDVVIETCSISKLIQRERWNFFDCVSKGHKIELLEQFNALADKFPNEKHRINIPFNVARFPLDVEGVISLDDRMAILEISEQQFKRIRDIELIRVKASLGKTENRIAWVIDDDGIIRDVLGENCERNLGWRASDLIGMNLLTFVSVEERAKIENIPRRRDASEVFQTIRINKLGQCVPVKVVRGTVKLHDGNEYTMFLDTYTKIPSK